MSSFLPSYATLGCLEFVLALAFRQPQFIRTTPDSLPKTGGSYVGARLSELFQSSLVICSVLMCASEQTGQPRHDTLD